MIKHDSKFTFECDYADCLTLRGTRPGTGYLILPGIAALCWTPSLKRAEGSEREHCWFLASTTRPTLYCWTCKPGVA